MTEPTDDELAKLFTEETGFDVDDFPAAILDFARAARQRWGPPSGAGEAAEHYRNAIASACEGWTMPDGLRKHLETALWSPPTPQPTQAVPPAGREPLTGEQIQDAAPKYYVEDFLDFNAGVRFAEQHHGIKGKEAGNADQ